MAVLDSVNCVADIKKLNMSELTSLCQELRERIIDTTGKNGGHLASNLGIIETTVALYYVFDFPNDKLIFDVGHQCYAHKILSGRKDKFDTIRMDEGISGFPDKDESQFDLFTTGHAGTSISSSLGLCTARDKNGQDYTVINVVGDGSIINGLNLEAISSNDSKPNKLLVILNDNEMSISQNVNGFYRFISKSTVKKGYIKRKKKLKKILGNSVFTVFLRKCRSFVKRLFNRNNYFEKFGFKYVGVVDGNDIKEMVKVLTSVKDAVESKAVFLHIKTTKGKGLEEAELHSDVYHGVGKNMNVDAGSFSEEAGKIVSAVIEEDNNVVVVTSAMKDGTGMKTVEEAHPDNFFDVGIAEEFAVTYASGMARGGLKPIVAVYSTFLQRAYDQISHDVCLQDLPVVFLVDRAGFVGSDGKTHQGVFDLSFLVHLPNMHVFAPTNKVELNDILRYALSLNKPCAIRYPNDRSTREREVMPIKNSLWEELSVGKDVNILAVGPRLLEVALEVSEKLKGQGIDVGVINARSVKPLDVKLLERISDRPIVTLEENQIIGGFGGLVKQYLSRVENRKVVSLGICDRFVEHGSIKKQMQDNGLTVKDISNAIIQLIKG